MDLQAKLQRIVEARMKLKERFFRQEKEGVVRARGTGPLNRHGMPQTPPGQTLTEKWPILDLGYHPKVDTTRWRLYIDGEVEYPLTLTWKDFMDLPQTKDTSDFHCVTTWSKLDMPWEGVRFLDLAALVMPTENATHVMCYGYDSYTTNLPMEEALKEDVLIAHTVYGEPLAVEHGGPARMVTPQLYAWKGSKWIKRIRFMAKDERGFWEERGYSNTAKPWINDRYA